MKNELCKITFYDKNVEDEILTLPDIILANLLRIPEMVKEVESKLSRSHSTLLLNGLFEFITKGRKGITRNIFVNVINREIVILYTAIKKSDSMLKKI